MPPPSYDSAFARYRARADEQPLPWREANEAVARVGGWRAYAREAQQPENRPAGTPARAAPHPDGVGKDAPKPVSSGHGGHRSR